MSVRSLFLLLVFALFVPSLAMAGTLPDKVTFQPNQNPENLAQDSENGDWFVSILFPADPSAGPAGRGEVHQFDHDWNLINVHMMPAGTMLVSGLVVNGNTHKVYIVHVSYLPGQSGVYELDPDTGVMIPYGMLPVLPYPSLLNGLTPDHEGNLYMTDATGGVIWKVPAGGGEAQVWLDLQAAGSFNTPGPNGIKFSPDGRLYVAISSQFKIVRVRLADDGSPESVETFLQALPGERPDLSPVFGLTPDDFAFDQSGNLFLATEPVNSVVKIPRDVRKTIVTVVGEESGSANTTAVAFGRRPGEQHTMCFASGSFPFFQTVFPLPLPSIKCMQINGPKGFQIAEWREPRDCHRSDHHH